jgi:hypothetical protein
VGLSASLNIGIGNFTVSQLREFGIGITASGSVRHCPAMVLDHAQRHLKLVSVSSIK